MKNLKYLLLFLLIIQTIGISAQPPRGRDGGPPPPHKLTKEQREKIESMKIAFITKRLDLTPDEAKKFWPVYNQYSDDLDKQRASRMKQHRDMREREDLTDKDYEKIVDNEILFRQQELDQIKKYTTQFKQLLPMKKVAALYKAEEDFKRELLERMRDRKKGN